MAYCILRTKKLKNFGAVASSARHTFREEPTPNADTLRAHKNRYMGAKSSAGVLGALRELLPARRRKDAVLAIEYLVTASPEFFKDAGLKTTHTRAGFFNAALEFLRQKHGKQNVISAALHMDETTPPFGCVCCSAECCGQTVRKGLSWWKRQAGSAANRFF